MHRAAFKASFVQKQLLEVSIIAVLDSVGPLH